MQSAMNITKVGSRRRIRRWVVLALAAMALMAAALALLMVADPTHATSRDSSKDFNTLKAAGNDNPRYIWSNGTTMWVADSADDNDKIYAYKMSDKSRDSGKEFDTLKAAGNTFPRGIWSNRTTMWVADWDDDKLYAYNLSTKARDSGKDFNTLNAAGNNHPRGIWSNRTTMWVADWDDAKIYAYKMSDKSRDSAKDFNTLKAAGNNHPRGIWSDGTTMWVADWNDDKLYAYDLSTRERDSDKDFNSLRGIGNNHPRGIWSDGTTMWVVDWKDRKLYAYDLSPRPRVPSFHQFRADECGATALVTDGTFNGRWDDDDCFSSLSTKHESKFYRFTLPQGQSEVTFRLGGGGQGSRLWLWPEWTNNYVATGRTEMRAQSLTPGVYYLEVDGGTSAGDGAFKLTMQGLGSGPAGLTCTETFWTFTGSASVKGRWDAGCAAGNYQRKYGLLLAEPKVVTIEARSSDANPRLRLLSTQPAGLLEQNDGAEGVSQISRTLPAGRYQLEVVSAQRDQGGSFTLDVDVQAESDTSPDSSPPTASAGPDFSVKRGEAVVLAGSGTANAKGSQALTYSWRISNASHTELKGVISFLSDTSVARPTFTVPRRKDMTDRSALDDGNWIEFTLTVTDGDGESHSATVVLTISGTTWKPG